MGLRHRSRPAPIVRYNSWRDLAGITDCRYMGVQHISSGAVNGLGGVEAIPEEV